MKNDISLADTFDSLTAFLLRTFPIFKLMLINFANNLQWFGS